MTVRFAVALAFLLCVAALGIIAVINQFAIVDAVNAKLSASDQFNQFGWYPSKTLRLHREYRRLYPSGGLLRRQGILSALMLFCTVVALAVLGFGVFLIAWIGGGSALLIWFMYFRRP
jgi:hypothetical protein